MTAKAETDLDDVETEDLVTELEARGHLVYASAAEINLSEIGTDDLRDELQMRDGGPAFAEALSGHDAVNWLRSANPPQCVRDAYYEEFGRILV